jgi:uridine phosphorylase
MFEKREFPILEFDPNLKAKIEPSNIMAKTDVP